MNTNISFMFKIISSVVTNAELPEEPKDADWGEILRISLMHNITNIIAYAIISNKYSIDTEQRQKFEQKLYERIAVSSKQSFEIEKILSAFRENAIDHMPFKGTDLLNLYPSSDMRFMADADIFIKKEQFEKINQIMLNLGYTFEIEGPIEYNYTKKTYIHIELHNALIAPSSEDLYDYYKDGWRFAKKTTIPYRYKFGIEDHYIYLFNHFVRHYRDAGAGIKAVIDMWLYRRKYSEMNYDYIENELEKIKMFDFYRNLIRMTETWFEKNTPEDEITESMTEFIIDSGTFGNVSNASSANVIRKGKDFKKAEKCKYLNIIFPDFSYMTEAFPILKKFPVLLPFLWGWRLISTILFRRDNIQKRKNFAKSIDVGNVDKLKKHMNDVGLDIYNGRNNK